MSAIDTFKQRVDLSITNKTEQESIPPQVVGTKFKDLADLVDLYKSTLVVWDENYAEETGYGEGQIVAYGNKLYQSLIDINHVQPDTDDTKWFVIVDLIGFPIQNQNSSFQTANFRISGTGIAIGGLYAGNPTTPNFTALSSSSLHIQLDSTHSLDASPNSIHLQSDSNDVNLLTSGLIFNYEGNSAGFQISSDTNTVYSNNKLLLVGTSVQVPTTPTNPSDVLRLSDTNIYQQTLGYTAANDNLVLHLIGGTLTGDVQQITSPVNANSLITKGYVDNQVAGLNFKTEVVAASIDNVNISSAPDSLDDIVGVSGDRWLLKDQTDATQNGIYIFNGVGSTLTRSTDADTGPELANKTIPVTKGTTNQDTWWTIKNDTITIGVTNINLTQTGGAGTYTNGTGILLAGNIFSLDTSYTNSLYPQLITSYTDPSWIGSLSWSKITSTPTTLSGYSITDAVSKTGDTMTGALINNESISVGLVGYTKSFTSPNVAAHQGYAWDGTYHYVTDTNAIKKFDASWALVTSNSNPLAPVGVTHLGPPFYHNGYLYICAENFHSTTADGQQFVRYLTSDLSFVDKVDISASVSSTGALCLDVANNLYYIIDYFDGTVRSFNLTTYALVNTISSGIIGGQGIRLKSSLLYISSSSGIYTVDVVTGGNKTIVYSPRSTDIVIEGFDIVGSQIRLLEDYSNNGTNASIVYLDPITASAAFSADKSGLVQIGGDTYAGSYLYVTNNISAQTTYNSAIFNGRGGNFDKLNLQHFGYDIHYGLTGNQDRFGLYFNNNSVFSANATLFDATRYGAFIGYENDNHQFIFKSGTTVGSNTYTNRLTIDSITGAANFAGSIATTKLTSTGTISTNSNTYTNSFTSIAINSHQGYTTDGTNHYIADTTTIYKYNSSWTLIDSVTLASLGLSISINHFGDIKYDSGKLYVPAESFTNFTTFSHQTIVVLDAITTGMPLLNSYDISAQGMEITGVTVNGSELIVVSYVDGTKFWRYDKTTLAYIGSITLESPLVKLQGVDYYNNEYYFFGTYGIFKTSTTGTNLTFLNGVASSAASPEGGAVVNGQIRRLIDNLANGGTQNIYYYDTITTAPVVYSGIDGQLISKRTLSIGDNPSTITDYSPVKIYSQGNIKIRLDDVSGMVTSIGSDSLTSAFARNTYFDPDLNWKPVNTSKMSFAVVLSDGGQGELRAAAAGSTITWSKPILWNTTSFFPDVNNTYDVGLSSNRYKTVYGVTFNGTTFTGTTATFTNYQGSGLGYNSGVWLIGRTTSTPINASSSFAAGVTPKMEIITASGASASYDEIAFKGWHNGSATGAGTRAISMGLGLSDEASVGESNKSFYWRLESTNSFAGSPDLFGVIGGVKRWKFGYTGGFMTASDTGSLFINNGTVNELVSRDATNSTYNDLGFRAQGTAQLYLKNNGTIGINTTTPQAKLDVVYQSTLTVSAENVISRFADNTTTTGSVIVVANTNSSGSVISMGIRSTNSQLLALGTAGASTAISILNSGLVGFGTTAPTHTLTLPSTATGTVYYNTTDQTTNYERLRVSAVGTNGYSFLSEKGGTGTSRSILFAVNNATYLGIDATQVRNMEYGAAAAFAMIRLNGTTASPTALLVDNQIGGMYISGAYDTTGTLSSNVAALQFLAAENWSSTAQGTYFNIATTPIGSTTRATRLTIDNAGNVGIGTIKPRQQLSIGTQLDIYTGSENSGVPSIRATANNLYLSAFSSSGDVYINKDHGSGILHIGSSSDGDRVLIDASASGGGTIATKGKITATLTTEQLRLAYDATNYATFTTNSSGILTIGSTSNSITVGSTNFSAANLITQTVISPAANQSVNIQTSSRAFTAAGNVITLATGTYTSSSGQSNAIRIAPTWNQTGSASATDLLVNRTETALGSGPQLLIDLQVAGSSKMSVDNLGKVTTVNDIEITDNTKGVILKSPNGTRWRVTINDSGVLTSTSL